MNLIKYKYIFLGISAALVLLSWVFVGMFGLKKGIDLEGGTEWSIRIEPAPEIKELQKILGEIRGKENASVKKAGDGTFILRLEDIGEEAHREELQKLREKFREVEEKSFSSIGPSIGKELERQAVRAGLLVLLGISLYVAWAFRKLKEPVAAWKCGLATLITLFHDVSIPMGLLALLGRWKGIEIDTNFIVALLVVMGFSVHDTIVVFDRIRENLLVPDIKKESLGSIMEKSVKETMARSINTSLTLQLVLISLLLWGPEALFYFILTILVGTVVGTYSSICVATPLVYIWSKK